MGKKKQGPWFSGDVFRMSSKETMASRKYEIGVEKPTSLRTTKKKGKTYSQYYHKPIYPGEFWD